MASPASHLLDAGLPGSLPRSRPLSRPLVVLALLVAGCATGDPIDPAAGTSSGQGGGPGTGGAGPGGGEGGQAAASPAGATSTATSGDATTTSSSTGGGGSSSTGGGCGDGVIDGDEACDGDDLGGATCAAAGFDGGTPTCDATCAVDLGGCTMLLACENGVDDDADGLIDGADPACTGAGDDDERVVSTSCDGFGGPVVDLTTAPGTPVEQVGTTVGAPTALTSTTTASCPATGGPEVVFRLVLTETRSLFLSLDNPGTSAGWDPVLYVRSGSCTGVQVGCNDDAGGPVSELVLSSMPAGTYYVFVDSAGSAGDFHLTVTDL